MTAAWRMTRRMISRRLAPSANRVPSSRVRRRTLYDITPWMPTAASASAMTAKPPSVGLDLPDRRADRGKGRQWIADRADKQRHAVAILPFERKIQIGPGRIAERCSPEVTDAPDDLDRAGAELDPLANRIPAREIALGDESLTMTTGGASCVSCASKSRPARSGMRSARK
jgi:hypothetical protein